MRWNTFSKFVLLLTFAACEWSNESTAIAQAVADPPIKTVTADAPLTESPWVRTPSKEQQRSTPGLVHETFESRLMKTLVGYSVVLPAGYENGERRYPVVYWLHGGGGNECSSLFTANGWRPSTKIRANGTNLEDVILVYPNAGRSGYMDHYGGKILIESLIVQELIPRIDSRFRTIDHREGRAVHGFSMGASGALKFAIKYPDLFCSAVAYGGGAINLETSQDPFITNILQRNFNGDARLIRQNNTYRMLDKNHARLKELDTPFLLICGGDDSWKSSAVDFQAALKSLGISCELKLVPGVGHDIRSLAKAEGRAAAEFQDRVFKKTKTSSKLDR